MAYHRSAMKLPIDIIRYAMKYAQTTPIMHNTLPIEMPCERTHESQAYFMMRIIKIPICKTPFLMYETTIGLGTQKWK